MKKNFISAISLLAVAASAQAATDVVTLDLTQATTELTFDADNGAWTGTFDDDAATIDSQVFSFVHGSMSDWQTWWGFTASNSADNSRRDDTITYQYSNMAQGGIVLNDDGTVALDDDGTPTVSPDVPYLVAYYSSYMAARPVDMAFNDGREYEAVGVYVNLNSYPYYSIEQGDGYCRPFHNGDSFSLTVHGVAADESERTVEVPLASFANGDITINRGWKYVDLTSLGSVNELYFTMTTTDVGDWGPNTPLYFCLDKLMVKPVADAPAAIAAVGYDRDAAISYDRATATVSVQGAGFAAIYDTAGRQVTATDAIDAAAKSAILSIASLPAGVYIVKAGNSSLKIAR